MFPNQLLLYCRPGFEHECAAEIQDKTAEIGCHGYVKAKPRSGYCLFIPYESAQLDILNRLGWRDLIFARQLLRSAPLIDDLPVTDRITPLLCALAERQFAEVWLETADTNQAKTLSAFCRKFFPPLRQALLETGVLRPDNPLPRLHLFFLSSTAVYPACSRPHRAAPWPQGIPRLKMPRAVPSRSARKLEEALQVLLTPEQRQERLSPGLRAVDLGAAPGGWTWLLSRRGFQVTAVDNGPLNAQLLGLGRVEHRREDGFRYRPPRPVDWLVCDMVEQPVRIAKLVADWFKRGDCRHCLFNLKLPMKKRYAEVLRCRALIDQELAGLAYRLELKQLYHDREEVSGYLSHPP